MDDEDDTVKISLTLQLNLHDDDLDVDMTKEGVLAAGSTSHRPATATAAEVGFAGGLSSVIVTALLYPLMLAVTRQQADFGGKNEQPTLDDDSSDDKASTGVVHEGDSTDTVGTASGTAGGVAGGTGGGGSSDGGAKRNRASSVSGNGGAGKSKRDRRGIAGAFRMMAEIAEEEGVLQLYQGLSATLASVGCSQFAFFFFYDRLAKITKSIVSHGRQLSLGQDLAVGYCAGVVNTVLTNPLWVAATRMKLQNDDDSGGGDCGGEAEDGAGTSVGGNNNNNNNNDNTNNDDDNDGGTTISSDANTLSSTNNKKNVQAIQGFWGTLAEVIRSGGAWKGLGAGVLLCTNPAINYGLFEQIKKGLIRVSKTRQGGTLNAGPAFLAGVVAKTVATVLTYPLQLVQVHSQKSTLPGGFVVSAEALIAQHGWDLTEYFRGMSSKLLMTVLSMALVFAGKETLLRWTVRLRQALPKMLANTSKVKFRKHTLAS